MTKYLKLLRISFRTTRFASFPDYLVIQIKKFTFGLDWVPKKLGKEDEKYRVYRYWESYIDIVVITTKKKVTIPKVAAGIPRDLPF